MRVEQRNWTPESGWAPAFQAGVVDEQVQLVLAFGSLEHVQASSCLEVARSHYPNAHVAGCTTAGQIHGVRVSDNLVALTAVAFDHTQVALVQSRIEGVADSRAAGARLARALVPEGLRHLFVLSEGVKVNPSELVAGIDSALPTGVAVSGGCAGDGNRLQTTYVWGDGQPTQSSVVGVGFYGDRLQVGVTAIGGWRPFGPARLITRSEKNVVYEFDGRPALALYKRYLGKHAEDLPSSGMMFPLELRADEAGRRVLRSPQSVDEAEQSITYAGNVPAGAQASFMFATIGDLIEGTLAAAKSSVERFGPVPPELSILVSCNGRRYVLKQRTEEEVEAVHEALGHQSTLAGFYSYGEIAPAEGGGASQLHNETMTITWFAER